MVVVALLSVDLVESVDLVFVDLVVNCIHLVCNYVIVILVPYYRDKYCSIELG